MQSATFFNTGTKRPGAACSVANWQKFRPQNAKVTSQKSQQPDKSAAEFSTDLQKNGRKEAELF
jgi:hypothetical protein